MSRLWNKAIVVSTKTQNRTLRSLCRENDVKIGPGAGFGFPCYYMVVPTVHDDREEVFLVPNSKLEAKDGMWGVSDRGLAVVTLDQFREMLLGEDGKGAVD